MHRMPALLLVLKVTVPWLQVFQMLILHHHYYPKLPSDRHQRLHPHCEFMCRADETSQKLKIKINATDHQTRFPDSESTVLSLGPSVSPDDPSAYSESDRGPMSCLKRFIVATSLKKDSEKRSWLSRILSKVTKSQSNLRGYPPIQPSEEDFAAAQELQSIPGAASRTASPILRLNTCKTSRDSPLTHCVCSKAMTSS